MADQQAGPDRFDFFVSYTSSDEVWAEWIAWHVRDLGFSVVFQKWDFGPGHSFVRQMDDALRRSDRVLAVVSERYLGSRFGTEEWQAKWAEGEGLVVPVRVDDVNPPGLLSGVVYVDLFDLGAEKAREQLRSTLAHLGPPDSSPVFPGSATAAADRYPGNRNFLNVPDRRRFCGRAQDLQALSENRAARPLTQVAVGMGGVGKTSIAIEYAYQYRSTFEWVGWIRGGTRTALVDGLSGFADSLEVPQYDTAEATAQAVKSELARSDTRWLLVVDDVAGADEVKGLLPQAGVGQVLLTSRNVDWASTPIEIVGVDVLPDDAAAGLLQELSGLGDLTGAARVAARLHGLPIALEQAAAAIRQRKWGFDRYLEILASRPDLVLSDRVKGIDRTVAEVLASSIDQAVTDADHAAAVLGVCAYLGSESIPRRSLEGEGAGGIEILAGGDELDVGDAVAALNRYHLAAATEDSIAVHGLVQETVRAAHSAAATELTDAMAIGAVEVASRMLNRGADSESTGYAPLLIAGHAAAVIDNVVCGLAELEQLDSDCAAFVDRLTRWADEQRVASRFAASLVASSAVYRALPKLGRPPRETVKVGRLCIAAMRGLGEGTSALQQSIDNLDLSLPSTVDEPLARPSSVNVGPEQIAAYNSLVDRAYRDGDFETAMNLKLEVLSATGWFYGHYSLEVARVYGELAIMLQGIGNKAAARKQMEKALPLFEGHLADDDLEMSLVRLNYAGVLIGEGRLSEARDSIEVVIQRFRDHFDGPHTLTAAALGQLSLIHSANGDVELASNASEECVSMFTAVHGRQHENVAKALANWAEVLQALGRTDEAESAATSAVEIYSSLLGPDHWETQWAAGILADRDGGD